MGLKGKKILVTGGAGFIGSHLVDRLINGGATVVVVDNLAGGRKENVNSKAEFYELNITDERLEELIRDERPEIVYHLAANTSVPKSVENPLIEADLIAGSINLLTLLTKYKPKKTIFTSSALVYGNTPNIPIKETEPWKPIAPYAIAKNTIENYLRFFDRTAGLPFVILRPAAIFGPRQVTGAMADYFRKLRRDEQAEIYGDGNITRDFVYIDDMVNICLLAIGLSDEFDDPVFNVGSGKEITLNELYAKIARLLGKESRPIYLPARPNDQLRYVLDYSKAKQFLGWEPIYDLDTGLKKIADSFE